MFAVSLQLDGSVPSDSTVQPGSCVTTNVSGTVIVVPPFPLNDTCATGVPVHVPGVPETHVCAGVAPEVSAHSGSARILRVRNCRPAVVELTSPPLLLGLNLDGPEALDVRG